MPKHYADVSETTIPTPTNTSHNISVVRLVRRINGPNANYLVEASDGFHYVLKMGRGASSKDTLLREALGSELSILMELPVPHWEPLFVSDAFLKSHSGLWRDVTGGSGVHSSSGIYFGSRMLGMGHQEQLYDYIPTNRLEQVENRTDFVGMLLVDAWANHAQCRQAVFLKRNDAASLQAHFIDHGEMFAPDEIFTRQTFAGRYSRSKMYDGCLTQCIFSRWQNTIRSVREADLRAMLSRIPMEWRDAPRIEQIISRLLDRRGKIADMSFYSPRSIAHLDVTAQISEYILRFRSSFATA